MSQRTLISPDPLTETSVRRNLSLLVFLQALISASMPIIVGLGGVVGALLSQNPAYATVPVGIFMAMRALSTIPAALLMQAMGRRGAYFVAALLQIIAGVLAFVGIYQHHFVLFCVGLAFVGFMGASQQSFRFAAADLVNPTYRPKAISWAMLGALVGGVIGPQIAIGTAGLFEQVPNGGAFLSISLLATLALPLLLVMRLAPMHPANPSTMNPGHIPLYKEMLNQRLLIAVIAGVVCYSLMSFLMTSAPVAMMLCGHSQTHMLQGVQWHVLAMYAPSFFTGHLIERYGKYPITLCGFVLIALSCWVGYSGQEIWHFWLSLMLLGIGWNFGFVGATALLTDCYHDHNRARIQSLNDFLVLGSVAMASFSSGQVLNWIGWYDLNLAVLPIIAVVILLLLWGLKQERQDINRTHP